MLSVINCISWPCCSLDIKAMTLHKWQIVVGTFYFWRIQDTLSKNHSLEIGLVWSCMMLLIYIYIYSSELLLCQHLQMSSMKCTYLVLERGNGGWRWIRITFWFLECFSNRPPEPFGETIGKKQQGAILAITRRAFDERTIALVWRVGAIVLYIVVLNVSLKP